MVRAAIKLTGLLGLLAVFSALGTGIKWLTRDEKLRKKRAARLVSVMCRRFGLPLLGINVEIDGPGKDSLTSPGSKLFISNHLSYVDVLIISAHFPNTFVTSQEIRNSFPLGWWADLGGSFFVERRNRNRIQQEVEDIKNVLVSGFSVTIFPEATSTNGDFVKPFKNSLFAAAIDSGTPVLPAAVVYKTANGRAIDETTRDGIFWYGDMEFAPHLWRLLSLRRVTMTLNILEPIPMKEGQCRKGLAEQSHSLISQCYTQQTPIKAPSPMPMETPQESLSTSAPVRPSQQGPTPFTIVQTPSI